MATLADTAIDKLSNAIQTLAREQRERQEDLQELFEEKRPYFVMEKISDVRKRTNLRKREYEHAKENVNALGKLSKAAQRLEEDYKKGATTIGESSEAMKHSISEALKFADGMTRAQQNMLLNMQRKLDANIAPTVAEMQALDSAVMEMGKEASRVADIHKVVYERADKLQRTFLDLREAAHDAAKQFFSMKTAVSYALSGVRKSFEDLEYSAKNQVPVMNTLRGSMAETAAAYGVTTRAMMEVQNEHTMALMAASSGVGGLAGSAQNAMQEFEGLRASLYKLTADHNESLRVYAQMREALSYAGVRYSADEFKKQVEGPDGMLKSMEMLAKMTGQSTEEIAKSLAITMKDKDIRRTMLRLDETQRRNRMRDIAQAQLMFVTKGMEIEQAREAVIAFEKLNAQVGPKERLKQAARIRGIMGAMGIEGGERVFDILRKPEKMRTRGDLEFLSKRATEMQEKMGTMYADETVQYAAEALENAMHGPVYDAFNATAIATTKSRELDEKQAAELAKQTSILSGSQQLLMRLHEATNTIMAWTDDAGALFSAGIIAAIAAVGMQIRSIIAILNAMAAKQGVNLPAGKWGMGKGGAWGTGGKIARVGGGALGLLSAGLIAKDTYDLISAEEGKRKKEDWGGTIGGALGAAAGGAIGFMGAGVGAVPGAVLGAAIGNTIGEQIGAFLDTNTKTEVEQKQLEKTDQLIKSLEQNAAAAKEQAEFIKKMNQSLKDNLKSTDENTRAMFEQWTANTSGSLSNRSNFMTGQ